MAALKTKFRTAMLLLFGCAAVCAASSAQTKARASAASQSASLPASPPQPDEATADRPLPDIVAMMHDVEANQRKAESVEREYIYHSVETQEEKDDRGQIKKTTVNEFDHYWVNGVPVRRMVKKNGKALSAEELTREDERIDKDVAKARARREQEDAKGKETDPGGHEEVTVSRLIELGKFANARRVQLNGRDTIAVDYAGDPTARTQNRFEDAIRDLSGTAWVDERDHVLVRAEGHFVNAFKVGAGLVVNIRKDTRFEMEQTKINEEVWLPARIAAEGEMRVLLFSNFNGSVRIVESDYRKFRATSTILPGATRTGTPQAPDGTAQP